MKARRKWILLGATAAEVASDEIPTLLEGKFQHDGVLVRTDILERQSKTQWRLIEVKAAMQVKEHHLYDVAIQHFVLEACGIKAKPTLMHVNGDYVYDGNQYELEKLF
jgi:phage terminase small subunit